jgi:hypothetical protein
MSGATGMNIGGLSFNFNNGAAGAASAPTFGQIQTMAASQTLALLPPASPPGVGGNLDIYSAISGQSMGLLAGGLEAVELANIKLGIDMSGKNTAAAQDAAEAADTGPAPATDSGDDTQASSGSRNITDRLLKEAGYSYTPNPYEVRTDFFADSAGNQVDAVA